MGQILYGPLKSRPPLYSLSCFVRWKAQVRERYVASPFDDDLSVYCLCLILQQQRSPFWRFWCYKMLYSFSPCATHVLGQVSWRAIACWLAHGMRWAPGGAIRYIWGLVEMRGTGEVRLCEVQQTIRTALYPPGEAFPYTCNTWVQTYPQSVPRMRTDLYPLNCPHLPVLEVV